MANLPHITRFGLPGMDRQSVQAHTPLRIGAAACGVACVRGPAVSGLREKVSDLNRDGYFSRRRES
jgi:hypothetical protein